MLMMICRVLRHVRDSGTGTDTWTCLILYYGMQCLLTILSSSFFFQTVNVANSYYFDQFFIYKFIKKKNSLTINQLHISSL